MGANPPHWLASSCADYTRGRGPDNGVNCGYAELTAGTIRSLTSLTSTTSGRSAINFMGPRWDDPALQSVVSGFGPGYRRYPGGTVSTFWRWRAGWWDTTPCQGPTRARVDHTLPIFANMGNATGASVLFNLNLVSLPQQVVTTAVQDDALRQDQLSCCRQRLEQAYP